MKRIHITNQELQDVHSMVLKPLKESNAAYVKPRGLWYAFDDKTWNEFRKGNLRDVLMTHTYEIHLKKGALTTSLKDVKKDKILQIKTMHELYAFMKKYGYTPNGFEDTQMGQQLQESFGKRNHFVDWKLVMSEFGGIEVYLDPVKMRIRNREKYNYAMADFLWIDALDIPSGVIWSTHLISENRLLEKKHLSPGAAVLRWNMRANFNYE